MKAEKIVLPPNKDALGFLRASDGWLQLAFVCVARAHVCREKSGAVIGQTYLDARECLENQIAQEREWIRLEHAIRQRLAGERGGNLGTG